jgi:hypothetical protein
MIVTPNLELRKQVMDNIRTSVVKDRPDIHLSDCIYCLRKAYFRKKGLSPEPSDELCLLWLTGFAFQTYMFPKDKEITHKIDGIDCTPDINSGIEVKSTRQSMSKFEFDSMTHWKRQILGYCKALNLLSYDLVVMHVCGDYKPPFPDIACWHIETTQEEVDANWLTIQEKAVLLDIALATEVPPAIDCEDWEADYCENIEFCMDSPCYRRRQLKKEVSKK